MVQLQDGRQTVTLLGVDNAISVGSQGVELTFRTREHVVLQHGTEKFSRTCSTKECVQINAADPPNNIGVFFLPTKG